MGFAENSAKLVLEPTDGAGMASGVLLNLADKIAGHGARQAQREDLDREEVRRRNAFPVRLVSVAICA